MSTLSKPSTESFDRLPLDGSELVAALGLVFVLSGVAFWSQSILPTTDTVATALYELVMHVLFGTVILLLGIHIERSELVPEERREVILWCFSAFLFFFWLAVWSELDAVLAATMTRDLVSNIVVFGSIGGAFGAIIGVNRGRATRNEILAERTEDQRETLELLTRLLRHDIRNDMQAVNAHAGFLAEEDLSEDGESSLGVIKQRSDAILRLLEDTSTLIETLGSDRELRPISLSTTVEQEAVSIRDEHPEVTVETDVPEDLQVVADGLLHQLFLNLLSNAVAHNDTEDLRIHVGAKRRQDLVDITVSDNGTGIPEAIRETCFELGEKGPGSQGDGLGLYLVSRLADVYGGSVTVDDSPSGGAQFDITLETAD
ncbi:sensor histidine kinase [Haloglomus halophilum]|uniref:sensor histidine kinase n=1 Tax=Haloglomus halophilum TaxID=2962672 RepID=UPI0020C9B3AA|nr:HAMP domain-containing sensor histidine kinase [Haloglomus halophilum]